MKTLILSAAILISSLIASVAMAEVSIGKAAPTFSEVNQAGKAEKLENYKGKWVVLEWYNEGCPYVKKHYETKNMQNLQKKYVEKGVAWLTVASSKAKEQGYVDPKEAAKKMKDAGMNSTALLLDADGTMGKSYDAKTTPHMFVINPDGLVVYAGAIDNDDSSNKKSVASAVNWVAAALDEGMAGKTITKTTSKAYGCGIKY